ncbi:MAG: hypothetical protein AAFU41_14930 [Pseudomonadota bacterium]
MTGPVIALSGAPGAGKTTIGRWLTEALGATRVNYDDYEQMTRRPPQEVAAWLDRGAPIAEIPAPGLQDAVARASASGTVIFETPLGRAWPATAQMITLSIWIDTPLDLALSRKLQIMARAWEEKGGPVASCTQWFTGHLKAYEEIIRPSLLVQNDRVRALADFSVSNGTDFAATKRQIVAALETVGLDPSNRGTAP